MHSAPVANLGRRCNVFSDIANQSNKYSRSLVAPSRSARGGAWLLRRGLVVTVLAEGCRDWSADVAGRSCRRYCVQIWVCTCEAENELHQVRQRAGDADKTHFPFLL